MEVPIKPILVPHDFTPVADNALMHAVHFAQASKSDIILLHVVKKGEDKKDAQQKLRAIAQQTFEKYNMDVEAWVREGNIFSTIKEFAEDVDAIMSIMGTHGMQGMQKFTGSWALKVVAGSSVPFVVVQEEPKDEHFSNIVFPMDFRSENKEKLRWANFLSHFYNTKIFISVPSKSKSSKIKSNVYFAEKYLQGKGINYEMTELPGKKSFAHETIDYAKSVNAGLVMIMTTKDIGLTDYMFGAEEQKIISNEAKIPVMCVNPRKDLHRTGGFRTTGY